MAEIDEFLQQVLADQKEWEADPTPKTPAYALLAAGRLEEAEALARLAVSDLGKRECLIGEKRSSHAVRERGSKEKA